MKQKFQAIVELCESKELNKDKYIEILKDMNLPNPQKEENSLFDSLQKMANKDYLYASLHADNAAVRLLFGERYIYYNLYRRITDMGIGHLKEFSIKGKRIFMTIAISPKVRKNENETNEEYQERKKKFFMDFPYEISADKNIMIKDTAFNKILLMKSLEGFLTIGSCDMVIRNDNIKEISLWVSDIVPYEKEQIKNTEFNLATVEDIMKTCKEAVDAIDFSDAGIGSDICNRLIASCYYHICSTVEYKSDWCSEYEKVVLPCRELNERSQKMAEEIGKTVSVKEMLETAKGIFDSMWKKFAKDLCFNASFSWHMGLCFNGLFSPDCCMIIGDESDDNFLERKHRFDDFLIKEKNYHCYCIGSEHINEVKNIFEKDYYAFNVKIKASDYDNTFCITEISGMIDDVLSLS